MHLNLCVPATHIPSLQTITMDQLATALQSPGPEPGTNLKGEDIVYLITHLNFKVICEAVAVPYVRSQART